MTLDEAIKHAEEVADTCEYEASRYDMSDSYESYMAGQQGECAEKHRQLAEWLKELQQLRELTRWIPVSEELPKEGGDYLVTLCFDICTKGTVREVRRNFFCILSKKWLYEDEDVIAWMPLPTSYNGGTKMSEIPTSSETESEE